MLTYTQKNELKAAARELVFRTEKAVDDSASCGFLGSIEGTVESFFSTNPAGELEDLCARQRRSVDNLKVQLARLEDLCESPFDQTDRMLRIADEMTELATGLADEAAINSWRTFLASYGERVGETVGSLAGGAADIAAGAAKGVVSGLGPLWTLVALVVVATYVLPKEA